MLFGLLCLTLFPAFGGARAAEAAPGEFPLYRDSQGRFLVDVYVNGTGPHPFLLDTAANRTVLYRSLAVLLELEALPFRSQKVITATGAQDMQVYEVGEIDTLGARFTLGETVVMPDPMVAGSYGIVGIDAFVGRVAHFKADSIAFYVTPSEAAGPGWHRVQGRPVGYGSLAVDIEIAGVTLPAIVDTGASYTILNQPAAELLRRSEGTVIEFEKRSLQAAAGPALAEGVVVKRLKIGDVSYAEVRALSSQLSVFATFGAASTPAVILGTDILSRQEVMIDFENWVLHIKEQ